MRPQLRGWSLCLGPEDSEVGKRQILGVCEEAKGWQVLGCQQSGGGTSVKG